MGSLMLAACSGDAAATGDTDPSKLSAELEQRAQAIEEKADMAAVAAEREAASELAALREEAGDGEAEVAEAAESTR